MLKAYENPGEIAVSEGEVVLIGPGPIAASFTPRAAAEAGRRLIEAAAEAEPWRHDNEGPTQS